MSLSLNTAPDTFIYDTKVRITREDGCSYGFSNLQNLKPLSVGDTIEFKDQIALGSIQTMNCIHEVLSITTENGKFILNIDNDLGALSEIRDIQTVVTAKGSRYSYLEDGTTQRFKPVENMHYKPQTILVYVPSWTWVQENGSKDFIDKMQNETIFNHTILQHIHLKGLKVYIVDDQGHKIMHTADVAKIKNQKKQVYLCLVHPHKELAHLSIPITHIPKIGFNTYDTRRYFDSSTQQLMTERHFGNKVIEIIRK